MCDVCHDVCNDVCHELAYLCDASMLRAELETKEAVAAKTR